ncbi:MAG: hypothetical protein JST82_02180 [Bacteroidetes bacterium]|nr:hypothetical protein [Bacteroidota bacterium]
MHQSRKIFWWVTYYSIAMGFLETAVVVYLRKLYYPNGFFFPLAPVSSDIAIVELWRELATLIMLISIGVLAGRNRAEKFAYFLYSFAIWDLFYYVFLKVFLNWPESLMTWDILFLLPIPWVGPVIAPCIIAVTMVLFCLTVIRFTDKGIRVSMLPKERWLMWLGALVVIISFTMDYAEKKGATLWNNIMSHNSLLTNLVDYIPSDFNWFVFIVGELMILTAYFLYRRRLGNIIL